MSYKILPTPSKNISFYSILFFSFLLFNSCKSKKSVIVEEKPIVEEVIPEPTIPETAIDSITEKENEVIKTEPVISETSDSQKEVRIPKAVAQKALNPNVPHAMREFRAAWIATVANINWPSQPGLSPKQQRQEAIALLDLLEANNFNAVILQVRPQADAFYKSALEPWSYFLTGTEGEAPEPFYDPLRFWIQAAHDRGMELHAWLNPYRAHHTTSGEISEKSIIKTNPELVVQLKNGMYWMDPSKKGTQKRTTAVVMDIVKRYDIDGIHFDDYFYPYDSYNGGEDFPDDESWKAYLKKGGELSRGDWRRENVNTFIKQLYKKIKAEKPYVKFGISPFGIWRPGYPASIQGYDQYSELYADARLWLKKGWVDYFSPQLYWPVNQEAQSFPVLLGWWSNQNDFKRHLWPGINAALGAEEIISQILITRGMLTESPGVAHWSIAPLVENEEIGEALIEGPYKKEALVPASPWLDNIAPKSPVVSSEIKGDMLELSWAMEEDEKAFRYVVYYKYGSSWSYKILDHTENSIRFSMMINGTSLNSIAITAVDRTGNESEFEALKL